MLRRIAAIIRKDTLVRFSSRSELLFFLILPLLFTAILSGLAFGGEGDNRTAMAVVDEDGQALAADLLEVLSDSTAVRVELMTGEEAMTSLEEGEIAAVLIIPAGFTAAAERGEFEDLLWRGAPGDANALVAEQTVQAAVVRVGQMLAIANSAVAAAESRHQFEDETARSDFRDASLTQAQELLEETPARLAVTTAAQAPEDDDRPYNQQAQASVGQLITWVFIPLLGTSGLFAFERTSGTLRRLLTTPAPKATMLTGTVSSQLLLALVQMFILIAFGILVFQVSWGDSPAALAVMLVTFGLASVAMGTMLGTFIKSEGQATGLSIALGMVMALLGGCWYPIELFPPAVQTAVLVLPTTWAMQGLLELVAWGGSMPDILLEAAVLTGFAIIFFIIGVRRFRYE